MRNSSQTNWWEYLIPGWNVFLKWRDLAQGNPFGGFQQIKGAIIGENNSTSGLENAANSVLAESREQYLSDREHTEQREDTSYQRAVADMRAAGLNPYTIGASGAPSSPSSVGSDLVGTKLQVLGYILDLKNLDAKNRKITNDAIGNILGLVKKVK